MKHNETSSHTFSGSSFRIEMEKLTNKSAHSKFSWRNNLILMLISEEEVVLICLKRDRLLPYDTKSGWETQVPVFQGLYRRNVTIYNWMTVVNGQTLTGEPAVEGNRKEGRCAQDNRPFCCVCFVIKLRKDVTCNLLECWKETFFILFDWSQKLESWIESRDPRVWSCMKDTESADHVIPSASTVSSIHPVNHM